MELNLIDYLGYSFFFFSKEDEFRNTVMCNINVIRSMQKFPAFSDKIFCSFTFIASLFTYQNIFIDFYNCLPKLCIP